MSFYDIEYGDILEIKCGTLMIFLPYHIANKICNTSMYPTKHDFFVLYHYDSVSPFSIMPDKDYVDTFPQCKGDATENYTIVKIFRPVEELNFKDWFKKNFSDFFKKIKNKIELR